MLKTKNRFLHLDFDKDRISNKLREVLLRVEKKFSPERPVPVRDPLYYLLANKFNRAIVYGFLDDVKAILRYCPSMIDNYDDHRSPLMRAVVAIGNGRGRGNPDIVALFSEYNSVHAYGPCSDYLNGQRPLLKLLREACYFKGSDEELRRYRERVHRTIEILLRKGANVLEEGFGRDGNSCEEAEYKNSKIHGHSRALLRAALLTEIALRRRFLKGGVLARLLRKKQAAPQGMSEEKIIPPYLTRPLKKSEARRFIHHRAVLQEGLAEYFALSENTNDEMPTVDHIRDVVQKVWREQASGLAAPSVVDDYSILRVAHRVADVPRELAV